MKKDLDFISSSCEEESQEEVKLDEYEDLGISNAIIKQSDNQFNASPSA